MTARAGDRVMASLARLLLRVFFRRIDVEGATRLPAGPVLLVANHVNGLVGRRRGPLAGAAACVLGP